MKAYTVNNHLVGVGNDQILGTDQGGGGGATYTAGDYISIEDDVISVTGISAGDGTFSIVQDVTGRPLEINYPTDVAPDAVFYQINAVTGYAYTTVYSSGAINYYYGETPADFNGSGDCISITIDDSISNVGAVFFYYATSETGMGGPYLSPSSLSGDSNGILQAGTYRVRAQYNQAGTSSNYGKYLQIMIYWRNYASDAAQSLQWTQDALSKISFFGVVRPDPSLGVTVNLDRYYLGGNIVSDKPTNSGLPAQIWLNPETKKQEVYLPNTVPSSWGLYTNNFTNYGSTPSSITGGSGTNYIAYKYDSSNDKYVYARMTCSDRTNKIAEFVTLEPVNGNFEKWTYDYSNSSNRHWTTEQLSYATETELQAVSGALDNYISYSASGVYLPNSKFEIDTNGQAYKVITPGSETAYNSFDDAAIMLSYYSSQLGTYKAILPSNTNRIGITNYGGNDVTGTYDIDTHTATINANVLIAGQVSYVHAYDSNNNFIVLSSSNTTVKRITPEVKEEYITDGDLELNGNSQVTAIDGHALAVPAAQVNSDWNANSGVAEILNKPTEIQLIAGTNVQVEVTGASAIISAQGGGGGHEYTAGPGIEINNYEISTTELASGLQLVAGAGITLTVSGNYLVVGGGADETVLYTASSASNSITTSEEVTHFERLRIELQSAQSTYIKNCLECKPDASNLVYTGTALIPAADYPLQMAGVRYTSSNAKNFTFSSAVRMCYRVNSTYGDSTYSNFASSDIKDVGFITKIVGINRISS